MPAINGLRNGTSTARTRNAFKTAELLDMERLRFGSRQKFVLGGVRCAVEALLQADDRNRDVGDEPIVQEQQPGQPGDLLRRHLVRQIAPRNAAELVEAANMLAGDLAYPARGLLIFRCERDGLENSSAISR